MSASASSKVSSIECTFTRLVLQTPHLSSASEAMDPQPGHFFNRNHSYPVGNYSTRGRGLDNGSNVAVAILLPAVSVGPKTHCCVNDKENEGDLGDISDKRGPKV